MSARGDIRRTLEDEAVPRGKRIGLTPAATLGRPLPFTAGTCEPAVGFSVRGLWQRAQEKRKGLPAKRCQRGAPRYEVCPQFGARGRDTYSARALWRLSRSRRGGRTYRT
jgi:hypothetical protein